jgi:cell division topological specificity factor
MKSILDRFFGHGRTGGSKEDAKSRLKVLLLHDQVDLSPQQMDAMKQEILEVIARYCEIDTQRVDVRLERAEDTVSVVSSVPVRRVTGRAATVSS